MTASIRLRCRFIPLVWRRGAGMIYRGGHEGPSDWEMDWPSDVPVPASRSIAAEELARSDQAPAWVRRWEGPYLVIIDGPKECSFKVGPFDPTRVLGPSIEPGYEDD